jgi:hypothetical protein
MCCRLVWQLDLELFFGENGALLVPPRATFALHTLNSSTKSGHVLACI